MLTNLFCHSLLPLNKLNRNKYELTYKISISHQDHPYQLYNYQKVQLLEVKGLWEGDSTTAAGVSIRFATNDHETVSRIPSTIDE